jgi:hypothetical protein
MRRIVERKSGPDHSFPHFPVSVTLTELARIHLHLLSKFKAITVRIAESPDTNRHVGLRFAKFDHLPSVVFNERPHLFDPIDLESETRMGQRSFGRITRSEDM